MATPEVNTPVSSNGLAGDSHLLARYKELDFQYFPAYARFLLEEKLEEFADKMLQLSRELDLPLLRFFSSYSGEQLRQFNIETTKNSLAFFAGNKLREYKEQSLNSWLKNEIPMISVDSIIANDITLLSFIRRKAFRDFLPFYTTEFTTCKNILEEIDLFTTGVETTSLNLLLNRQQSLYKQAQSLAHIGNWVWDLQKNKLIWSEELYHIYELPPGTDISNEKIASYNHPDDAEYVHQQMRMSAESRNPHDFYFRIILPDGREKTLHAKGEGIVDANYRTVQFIGTLQDVTEQKRFEKELTEKQNFIQKIADITPSLIAAYNVRTGQYIFVNNAIKKLLGYDTRDVMDNGVEFFIKLIHPDDIDSLLQKNAQALYEADRHSPSDDNETIVEFQYRLRHMNGEYKWFHTYATIFSRDEKRKVEHVLNVSVDITRQHQLSQQLEAEKTLAQKQTEELRRSEERYHRMINEVRDYAIILLDKEGNIQNWNLGAEKIKGYRSEEIVGRNFRVFYTPEDMENNKPHRLLSIATKEGMATDEGWRVRKDGSRFWGSIVITALHGTDDQIIGFSKVTRDLTERKQAEERLETYAKELEKKNEELVRTNKELESFTYIASHDLQEPLRKIQIFSNSVLSHEFQTLSEKGKEYFNRMFKAAQRMQHLIEDLLAFSRATSIKDGFEVVDLNELLKEVLSGMQLTIDESHAVIESAKLPVARIIPFQFMQVLQNLIANSIKYAKPGIAPRIKITVTTTTAKKVKGLNSGAKYHKIVVADEGIGFEPQHSERIFELFQRLHTKDEYPGTGIGLAIVKKIMQNHNGIIRAKGRAGKGASFELFIPAE